MAKEAPKPAPGNTPITFILNDETVINVYGFRVKNAALDLTRFEANPVMLAHHVDGISTVCGRWENIRIEGVQLKADAVFDMEDEDAAKIAGKVNRGFLKGCSLGFMAYDFVSGPAGVPELSKGEVLEASVCPIPGNAGALKLYAPNGTLLSASEIQLSMKGLSAPSLPTTDNPQKTLMNKITLSLVALTALGFSNFLKDGDEGTFALAVEKMAKEHQELSAYKTAAEKELAELKAKVQLLSGTQGKAIVDAAITAGKITEADREDFEALAASNLELAVKQIARLEGKKTLGAGVTPAGNATTDPKTTEEFSKLSLPVQLAFKADNPDAYKALFAKK